MHGARHQNRKNIEFSYQLTDLRENGVDDTLHEHHRHRVCEPFFVLSIFALGSAK